MKTITCYNLYQILKLNKLNNIVIIDLRTEEEFNTKHIQNSININYNSIEKTIKYLNKNYIYYLICNTGYLSSKVAVIMKKNGYNAVSVRDGFKNWIY